MRGVADQSSHDFSIGRAVSDQVMTCSCGKLCLLITIIQRDTIRSSFLKPRFQPAIAVLVAIAGIMESTVDLPL